MGVKNKPNNPEDWVRSCPRCNTTFSLTKVQFRKRFYLIPFCSDSCESAYWDHKASELVKEGKPLISVHNDHVVCNLCGRSMKLPGGHFSTVHKLAGGRDASLTVRQFLFNLPRGTRLHPRSYIEHSRKMTSARGELSIPKDLQTHTPYVKTPRELASKIEITDDHKRILEEGRKKRNNAGATDNDRRRLAEVAFKGGKASVDSCVRDDHGKFIERRSHED